MAFKMRSMSLSTKKFEWCMSEGVLPKDSDKIYSFIPIIMKFLNFSTISLPVITHVICVRAAAKSNSGMPIHYNGATNNPNTDFCITSFKIVLISPYFKKKHYILYFTPLVFDFPKY